MKKVWNPDMNRYEEMPYLPVPQFEIKNQEKANREKVKA